MKKLSEKLAALNASKRNKNDATQTALAQGIITDIKVSADPTLLIAETWGNAFKFIINLNKDDLQKDVEKLIFIGVLTSVFLSHILPKSFVINKDGSEIKSIHKNKIINLHSDEIKFVMDHYQKIYGKNSQIL